MNLGIVVACDGDWNDPELQISGSQVALLNLGRILSTLKGSFVFESEALGDTVYPIQIGAVFLNLDVDGGDLLNVSVNNNALEIFGNHTAFRKLGESLTNFFDGDIDIGEHFQLDYYQGNQILCETSCHLIFLCDK